MLLVGDKSNPRHGRRNPALPQPVDGKVKRNVCHGKPPGLDTLDMESDENRGSLFSMFITWLLNRGGGQTPPEILFGVRDRQSLHINFIKAQFSFVKLLLGIG
jgi:hypothetical protein